MGVVVFQIVNAFVIFAEREDAQIKRDLGLTGRPGFDRECSVRVNQRSNDVGVE